LTYVYAKTEQEVALLVGSDDGVRLGLNGQLPFLHKYPRGRVAVPDQDRVPATLRAGWNTVLAKVVNDTGRHGLFLRISAEPADLAQAFADKRQWDKALAYFDRAIEAERGKSGEPALRFQRGSLHAQLGRWQQAADDYARALELDPTDAGNWYRSALLRLQLGDRDGYRRACARQLERHANTPDPFTVNIVVWQCVLSPDAGMDLSRVVQLSERTVAGAPNNFGILNTLGVALYRAGKWQDAADRLHAAIKARPGQEGIAEDWVFLAMAHHRLQQPEEARKWLDKTRQWVEKQTKDRPKNETAPPPGVPWTTWLETQLFLAEAEALFKEQGR
jgi:tetratricopeptide (TPR) repeat protein